MDSTVELPRLPRTIAALITNDLASLFFLEKTSRGLSQGLCTSSHSLPSCFWAGVSFLASLFNPPSVSLAFPPSFSCPVTLPNTDIHYLSLTVAMPASPHQKAGSVWEELLPVTSSHINRGISSKCPGPFQRVLESRHFL